MGIAKKIYFSSLCSSIFFSWKENIFFLRKRCLINFLSMVLGYSIFLYSNLRTCLSSLFFLQTLGNPLFRLELPIFVGHFHLSHLNPSVIYLLKASSGNSWIMPEIFSKLTIRTLERFHTEFHTLIWCFHYSPRISKCRLGNEIITFN